MVERRTRHQDDLTARLSTMPFTPPAVCATCLARSRCSAESTLPLKVTVPSLVSTLISSDLSPGSARSAVLTLVVMTASSATSATLLVASLALSATRSVAVAGGVAAGAVDAVLEGERWLHADTPSTPAASVTTIRETGGLSFIGILLAGNRFKKSSRPWVHA